MISPAVLVNGRNKPVLVPSRRLVSGASLTAGKPSLFPQPKPKESTLDIFLPEDKRIRSDDKPVNIFAWGRRGKGKSLTIACLLSILHRGFQLRKSKRRILSNFWLEFADYNTPFLLEEIIENPFLAQNSEIGLDEITAAVPSRRAMARRNIDMARLIEQIRKLSCEFLFTTQFPTEVDKALLRQVDLFILTEAHIHPWARVNPTLAKQAYIDLYIFDYWGQFTGRFIPPQWPPPPYLADKHMRIFNICNVWNQYRTAEFVPTQWGSSAYLENVVSTQWEEQASEDPPAPEAPEATSEQEAGPPAAREMFLSDPETFDGWLAQKDVTGGRFQIVPAMVRKLSELRPDITNLKRLESALEDAGYEITLQGNRRFAQKKALG